MYLFLFIYIYGIIGLVIIVVFHLFLCAKQSASGEDVSPFGIAYSSGVSTLVEQVAETFHFLSARANEVGVGYGVEIDDIDAALESGE